MMGLQKILAATAITGSLGIGVLGLGAGPAQADDWEPWVPHLDDWVSNPVPPGQLAKLCPWHSPPGHWVGGPHGIPCT